jgi:uncharacterized membrane protein
MKWYLWILAVILGLNALVIVAIGLFLVLERFRASDEVKEDNGSTGDKETKD